MSIVDAAVSRFGKAVGERFATSAGEPEDLLRGPFEQLIAEMSAAVEIQNVVLAGEHRLAEDRIRA